MYRRPWLPGARLGAAAPARARRTDRDRQRCEFGFDVDEFAVFDLTRAHHLAETFDDVRLRRDWIGADHFRTAATDRFRHRTRAFNLLEHDVAFQAAIAPAAGTAS